VKRGKERREGESGGPNDENWKIDTHYERSRAPDRASKVGELTSRLMEDMVIKGDETQEIGAAPERGRAEPFPFVSRWTMEWRSERRGGRLSARESGQSRCDGSRKGKRGRVRPPTW